MPANDKRMAALAKARAARAAKRGEAKPTQATAKPAKSRAGMVAAVAVIVLVLVAAIIAAMVVTTGAANKRAAAGGLVPLRNVAGVMGRRAVIITRPKRSYVDSMVFELFYSAVADMGAGPALRVLDASDADGGAIEGAAHVSHDRGRDIDVSSRGMSAGELQVVIDAFKRSGAVVASSREDVSGVEAWKGHKDHIHVRYK